MKLNELLAMCKKIEPSIETVQVCVSFPRESGFDKRFYAHTEDWCAAGWTEEELVMDLTREVAERGKVYA